MKHEAGGAGLTVVCGVAGAGKTLSLRLLEDLGFLGIDNLPPGLIPQVLREHAGEQAPLAVAARIRGEAQVDAFLAAVAAVREGGTTSKVLFLEARESALLQRLADRRAGDADPKEALASERALLGRIRDTADQVLDTSYLSPAELKERLSITSVGGPLHRHTTIDVCSFGYKHGDRGGDMVFDVRFLPNPYYVTELKPLTGRDPECSRYVLAHESARFFIDAVSGLLERLTPAYSAQGKARLTVALGCTGGQHRSVAVAEALGRSLAARGLTVTVAHRELDGRTAPQTAARIPSTA